MKYEGNAAGNLNALDLDGANTEIPTADFGAMYPPNTPPSVKRAML
jgi:hypothetical protein